MNIIINYTGELNDYFTLTDDDGNSYEWHGKKGSSLNPEAVLKLIKRRLYPDAVGDIDEWIAANPDVEPKPWKSTHPKESKGEKETKGLKAQLKALEDRIAALEAV